MKNQYNTKIIAVEGLNGAGKSVFSQKLSELLRQQGYKVLVVKVPIYEIQSDGINHFGPEIYEFLNKNYQFESHEIDDMFSKNRKYIQDHIINKQISNYDFIIIDRWTMSGTVYSYFRSPFSRLRSNSDDSQLEPEPKKLLIQMDQSPHVQLQFVDQSLSNQFIIPDLYVFIDADLETIQYRIQMRSKYPNNESTQNQVYSTIDKLQHIRIIFRHYINLIRHKQKIIIIDDSSQTERVIPLLLS